MTVLEVQLLKLCSFKFLTLIKVTPWWFYLKKKPNKILQVQVLEASELDTELQSS